MPLDEVGYPPGNITNGDVWAITTAPAGPYGGYLMVFAGNSGASDKTGTGTWCYGPQAAPNGSWHFCGNDEYAGQVPVDVTMFALHSAKTRLGTAVTIINRDHDNVYRTTVPQ